MVFIYCIIWNQPKIKMKPNVILHTKFSWRAVNSFFRQYLASINNALRSHLYVKASLVRCEKCGKKELLTRVLKRK